jgi:hypothetical protein
MLLWKNFLLFIEISSNRPKRSFAQVFVIEIGGAKR